MLASPHLPALPAYSLGSIPAHTPFPLTLAIGVAAAVAFGIELAVARLWAHPPRWVFVLLVGCVAVSALLALWAGYYTLTGPLDVEPRLYPGGRFIGAPGSAHLNPWYRFYVAVIFLNMGLLLVVGALVASIAIGLGVRLLRRRGGAAPSR